MRYLGLVLVSMICWQLDSPPVDAGEKTVTVNPLVIVSGNNSFVRREYYQRVTSAKDWIRVWLDHIGLNITDEHILRPTMEVDFDRCFVVVIFRGEKQQVYRVDVHSVTETSTSLLIRFRDSAYSTGHEAGKPVKPRPPEKPYCFIVLPKSDKTIVLEKDVANYKIDPPSWKEVHRLEVPQTPAVAK